MRTNTVGELAASLNHIHDILSHTVYSTVLEMETAVSSRLFVPNYTGIIFYTIFFTIIKNISFKCIPVHVSLIIQSEFNNVQQN